MLGLENISMNDVGLGLIQGSAALLLCAGVVGVCLWYGIDVRKETAWSSIRGLIQMLLVGILLGAFFEGGPILGLAVLTGMLIAAAKTASQRGGALPKSFAICAIGIAAAAGVVLTTMLLTDALSAQIAVLVPIGSMIIANAMNASAQALERFRGDLKAHKGEVETALALGAHPRAATQPFFQNAVYASLLPRLDMLKSLGLVWIPGVMAGMMVSGASPVYAALYQFVVVAMILAASGIAGLITTALAQRTLFSTAQQLLTPALAD